MKHLAAVRSEASKRSEHLAEQQEAADQRIASSQAEAAAAISRAHQLESLLAKERGAADAKRREAQQHAGQLQQALACAEASFEAAKAAQQAAAEHSAAEITELILSLDKAWQKIEQLQENLKKAAVRA